LIHQRLLGISLPSKCSMVGMRYTGPQTRYALSDRELHAAELAEIKRKYFVLLDCAPDAIAGLHALEEFFKAHPEYLNVCANASFVNRFNSNSMVKLLSQSYGRSLYEVFVQRSDEQLKASAELDNLIRDMMTQISGLRLE